jgi:hypothetical protein
MPFSFNPSLESTLNNKSKKKNKKKKGDLPLFARGFCHLFALRIKGG